MNLIKLIKYVNIETATKPYRLKSISSIEDSYIKVATRGVFKNFAIFTGKQLSWSLFLIKLQVGGPATSLKRDSNTGVFLCILQIFIYFEKASVNGCF